METLTRHYCWFSVVLAVHLLILLAYTPFANSEALLIHANSASTSSNVVNVGILHSLTGTLAISEITVVEAELMAIDEINKAGGLLGKQIVPLILDGQSSASVFAQKAQQLTANASIVNVFGCWTSASRKAVKPIFEASNILLWYPIQYEGQECSPSIMYSGAAPNQQLEPAVRWLLYNYPTKPFFLVGSDYVYPRTSNAITKAMLTTLGRSWIAEEYCVLPSNDADVAANKAKITQIISMIQTLMPDGGIILNTLNGDANVEFFTQFQAANFTVDKYPTMSFSITETEISSVGKEKLLGHYTTWNYFMTDPSKTPITDADYLSKDFIQAFWKQYNDSKALVNDPMEAAYIHVKVWALAVQKAQTFDADKVRRAAYGLLFDAPEGTVTLRPNHHFAKYVRIGKLGSSGRFDVVFETTTTVNPQPWNQWLPTTRGYICDHRVANGTMYKPPSVNVILLYSSDDMPVLDAQRMAVDEVNTVQGGINNKLLVPIVINIDFNETTLIQMISNFTSTDTIDAVFGTSLNPSRMSKWTRVWSSVKSTNPSVGEPIMYLPPSYYPACSQNVVYMGPGASQVMTPTLTYLQDQNINGIFVVGEQNDPNSEAILSYVNRTLHTYLPNTAWLGSCQYGSNLDCNSILTAAITSTPSSSRIVIINTMYQSNPQINSLFSLAKTWTSPPRSQTILIMSTSIGETHLTTNMTNHYAIGTYFQDIQWPSNSVFLSSFRSLYGTSLPVTESMEKAYTSIAIVYPTAATAADSTDPTSVRVNGWGTYNTPAGDITIEMSNKITSIVRIARVINLGGKLKYRTVLGQDSTYLVSYSPQKGEGINQDEVCYFGPRITNPSSFDALRYIVIIIAACCIVFFIITMLWVAQHAHLLVIRHSGALFLYLMLTGCIINLAYVFLLVPVVKTRSLCIAEFWPIHAGFILVFAGLIQKVYTIFNATRRRKYLKPAKNARHEFIKQVSFACVVFLAYMIFRSIFESDQVEVFHEEKIPGVLIQETMRCRSGVWNWSILGIEVLMVVVGISLSLQVREVHSVFNESFHLGMAIYVWAFVKIINEVFLLFIPFDYQIEFGMKAVGEIIPSLHTVVMFLYPKFIAVSQGKGDEMPVGSQSSKSSTSSSNNGGVDSGLMRAPSRGPQTKLRRNSFTEKSIPVPPLPPIAGSAYTDVSDSDSENESTAST
ncbi:hypothetical protein HDU76_001073 [Blyttiomyces sp. JEL0837]|nr:hypothetical protein HDU76_001073 [Blyttiomyces sp. JEL0837]